MIADLQQKVKTGQEEMQTLRTEVDSKLSEYVNISVCVCVCVCVHMCVCTRVSMCAHVHACVCVLV